MFDGRRNHPSKRRQAHDVLEGIVDMGQGVRERSSKMEVTVRTWDPPRAAAAVHPSGSSKVREGVEDQKWQQPVDTGSQKWKAHENEQLITVESHSLTLFLPYCACRAISYLRCLRPLPTFDFLARLVFFYSFFITAGSCLLKPLQPF